jgi:predicted esterase
MRQSGFHQIVLAATATLASIAWGAHAATLDQADAARLGRQYLTTHDSPERSRLAFQLAGYEGDIEPIIKRLSARAYEQATPGYHPIRHFSVRELRKNHPKELLYFDVPESYRPDTPTGLIVFMHGGGKTTSLRAPRVYLDFADEETPPTKSLLGDLFAATGMIAVGASALEANTSRRWCVQEADEYLADVIAECKSRFNIDPDRVFLMGHSMGGFGAYHHIQRKPDRFAAVVASSGSWSLAYWPVIQGTPLCIVHGVHDARDGVRWHFTDIEYARWTDKILTQQKLDHVYLEHDGKHAVGFAREKIAEFFKSAGQLRRDPYFPHVALASPVGFKQSFCYPVQHNRWLTLDKAVDGQLNYDALLVHGANDFSTWRLEHRVVQQKGAAIEAVNRGDNTIVVTTRNVARFTVWLHPRMVDLAKPVVILVNGRRQFSGRVRPSLATALESYLRRDDWGLIYPIKVELTVGANPPSQRQGSLAEGPRLTIMKLVQLGERR